MDKLKVLLFAMTGFGNEVLKSLVKNHLCQIVAVITPLRNTKPFPYYECKHIHEDANDFAIPIYEGLNLKNKDSIEILKSFSSDIILVATFNQILPVEVVKIARLMAINLHPSLLPKYRGATPTTWAINNGEQKTGVTAHLLTRDVDRGDIIIQKEIDIDINDTDGTLRKKLAKLAGEVSGELISKIYHNNICYKPQDEKKATYFSKRQNYPLTVDSLMSENISLHNKIRSHLPYPGVQMLYGGGLSVKETNYHEDFKILEIKSELIIMYLGNNIILRPFEKRDIEIYRQWVNDGEIASLVDRVLPVTEIEHERWYSSIQQNQSAVVFAIDEKSSSKYIGNVWLYNIDYRHRKSEVRILIGDNESRGKGIGAEALEMISWFAFNKINLHKLYAYVLSSNIRAKKAFEKAGFIEEGILKQDRFVNGRYEDVFLMGKINDKNI